MQTYLNEEIIQKISNTQFENWYNLKYCCDASYKKKKHFQLVSDINKCRTVAYQDYGLSYPSFGARVDKDSIEDNEKYKPEQWKLSCDEKSPQFFLLAPLIIF